MFDDHRENFSIETVRKRKRDFGITNGQLWYDDRPEAEQSELSDISDRDERPSGVNKELYYTVTLNFKTDDYGAYRKYVIFDFGEYPVYFRTVCFDCVRKGDGTRLSNATQYNLQQMDRRWQGPSV
ncbi:uncharacterized protein, partial [Prorops nasuta]|uniref:uncharacterized protein n=2 Tax=Prorops nasuta TaxID=863751 RepID=UPI0034CFEDD6